MDSNDRDFDVQMMNREQLKEEVLKLRSTLRALTRRICENDPAYKAGKAAADVALKKHEEAVERSQQITAEDLAMIIT